MATAWCPNCRSEYREGIAACADCGTELVPSLADLPTQHHDVSGPFLADDELVEVTRVFAFEAEVIAARLRGADIPAAVLGAGTAGLLSAVQYTQGSRVMVRRADLSAAQTVVSDLFGDDMRDAPASDDELGALTDDSAGWSDPGSGAVV